MKSCNKDCLGYVKCKEIRFDDPEITLGVMFFHKDKFYIKGKFSNLFGGFSYQEYEFVEFKPDDLVSPLGKSYQCDFLKISYITKDLIDEMIMTGPEFFQKIFHGKEPKN